MSKYHEVCPPPLPTSIDGVRLIEAEKREGPSSPLNGRGRIPLNLFSRGVFGFENEGRPGTHILELASGWPSEQGRGAMARSDKAAKQDVALLYAATDDGKGARVIRARD